MTKKKKNLEGYKQKGKRFIPPIKQLPQTREFSYVSDMLPELVWLGLIHDHAGYRFGAKVLEAVIEVTKGIPSQARPINYALQASYANLQDEVKVEITRGWEKAGLLETICHAIAPLIILYDGCPLSFAGSPKNPNQRQDLINQISATVQNHLDKSKTPGIVLHGTLLLTRLIAGNIRIAQHISIPDLNAVITSPGSEEARLAASFMRANAGAEWGMLGISNDWARHFWNRNAELSKCTIPDYLRNE